MWNQRGCSESRDQFITRVCLVGIAGLVCVHVWERGKEGPGGRERERKIGKDKTGGGREGAREIERKREREREGERDRERDV